MSTPSPEVTKCGLLSMQVCVPKSFTYAQAEQFANASNPAGTTGGWVARRKGHPDLRGDPARCPCSDRPGCVHIMLDC